MTDSLSAQINPLKVEIPTQKRDSSAQFLSGHFYEEVSFQLFSLGLGISFAFLVLVIKIHLSYFVEWRRQCCRFFLFEY